jgi:hypothetical protein
MLSMHDYLETWYQTIRGKVGHMCTDHPSQVFPVYKRIEDSDDVVIQRQCFAIADTRAPVYDGAAHMPALPGQGYHSIGQTTSNHSDASKLDDDDLKKFSWNRKRKLSIIDLLLPGNHPRGKRL